MLHFGEALRRLIRGNTQNRKTSLVGDTRRKIQLDIPESAAEVWVELMDESVLAKDAVSFYYWIYKKTKCGNYDLILSNIHTGAIEFVDPSKWRG